MEKQLAGRAALITGANRGIGLAVAKAYAAQGARCILAGRNLAALEAVARQIGNASVLPLDLEKPDAIRAATRSDSLLRKSDAGRVIVVSSGAARTARPGGGSYAVTKAALEMMAAVYAQEVAGTPIRINMVNPGPTRVIGSSCGAT